MNQVELYKGFNIRAYEREPGRWRADIRKADGSLLAILLPGMTGEGKGESIITSADRFTAAAAIDFAKEAIDGGGMK
jgi:hypothetical protein